MMPQINSKSRSSQRRIIAFAPFRLASQFTGYDRVGCSATLRIAQWVRYVLNEIAGDKVGSGGGRTITAGSYAELTDESAGHVTLVREAGQYGCLGRCLPVRQKAPREAHASLNKVCMRRDSC